jgi:RNA 3'-phosphate cyclase
MIKIDGATGGGQMLRLALSFSVLEERPFRMVNIRGGRSDPGLKPQHCAGVRLMQELSNAEFDGAEPGSEELLFRPSTFDPQDMKVDIGTAGSIPLLFQILLPLCFATTRSFTVTGMGGTDVKWSPPAGYLRHVTLPMLKRCGADLALDVERRGFYPKGGGRAGLTINPSEPERMDLREGGNVREIRGVSIASTHLEDARVADRQRKEARRRIKNEFPSVEMDIETRYVETASPGSSIVLAADYGGTVLGADALGEKGKRSEVVGREAADELLEAVASGAAVDRYMADQLIPFLAIAGGEVAVPTVTDHVETSIAVAKHFLDTEFTVTKRETGAMIAARS